MGYTEKKKVILATVALLILINVSFSYAYHPVCDPDDEGIHGVYIDGECYNCGNDDGICPTEYGAECPGIPDNDCVYETEAFWSIDRTTKFQGVLNINPITGKEVFLKVKNLNADSGTEITLIIKEKDTLNDDELGETTCIVNENNTCIGKWTIDSDSLKNAYGGVDDEQTIDDLGVLYFNVAIGKDIIATSSDLEINITYEEEFIVTSCSDYASEENCTSDFEGVGGRNLPPDEESPPESGCFLTYEGACTWSNDECIQSITKKSSSSNPDTCEEIKETTCHYPSSMEVKSSCEGADFFTIKYSSPNPECESWETPPIPCPAKLRLPFFPYYGIIPAIGIIILAYAGIFLKRRICRNYKNL